MDWEALPIQPHLIQNHGEAMEQYLAALEAGRTLKEVMGAGESSSWHIPKPRVVAWMASNCHTKSRREQYVRELRKYVKVETYGGCGARECRPYRPYEPCWRKELTPNYSFYLAMENTLCQDYITEKLYNSLLYHVVPVVWGGADYSLYLPPHSYINAREYHPKDLARLLHRLHQDPVEYGRYHLWRGFYKVHASSSYCELCHRLHHNHLLTPPSIHQHHHQHHTRHPLAWFTRPKQCSVLPNDIFSNNNTWMINKDAATQW